MAKRPRAKKNETPSTTAALIAALKFVAVAQRDIGQPYQAHVQLSNRWAIAFDGVIAAGHPIEEELQACPHTLRLIDALGRCGEALAITQLDAGRLSIKSGAFKAVVPCVGFDVLGPVIPDTPIAYVDDRIKEAFAAVAPLASDNAQHVVTASILLRAGSAVATDRSLMLEYWHGIDLPPGIVLPKAAATAILKIDKPLARFGFSPHTATFYFEDGSWLRTQLYNEQWPDIDRILNVPTNPVPAPDNLFTALAAIEPFAEDGNVRFDADVLRSHDVDGIGASYEVAGLRPGSKFNAKRLRMVETYMRSVDFDGPNNVCYFFGDNIRGALTKVTA